MKKYQFLITFTNGQTYNQAFKNEKDAIKGMKSYCENTGWEILSVRKLSKYPTFRN